MEKIKLNDFLFPLKTNGVNRDTNNKKLHINFKPEEKTLEEIEKVFSNKENTKKISVIDANNETVEIINDFVNIKSIKKELNEDNEYTVSIELEKDNIENRIEKLEAIINKVVAVLGLDAE